MAEPSPLDDRLFDNSGNDLLRVPGINGISSNYELCYGERFAHAAKEWCQLPGITVRELLMTDVMNQITDVPEWHEKIFDSTWLAEWRARARKHEVMSSRAWKWCVQELRDKARKYKDKGFVRVLDTGSCVCKMDLTTSLKAELEPLRQQTRDLVDPYMHPLRYGRTRYPRRGAVKLCYVLDASSDTTSVSDVKDSRLADRLSRHAAPKLQDDRLWSMRYQRLPCDVEVTDRLRIVSYINGLHPRHCRVYEELEIVIEAAAKMWSECLIRGPKDWQICTRVGGQHQRGGYPLRVMADPDMPDGIYEQMMVVCELHKRQRKYHREVSVLDDMLEGIPCQYRPPVGGRKWPEMGKKTTVVVDIIKAAEEAWEVQIQHEDDLDRVWECLEGEVKQRKMWNPHVGSYGEWAGNQEDGIWERRQYERQGVRHPEPVVLKDMQVIVQISEGGYDWRLEGLNERIVASAIYVYDGECEVSFRQETPSPWAVYDCGNVREFQVSREGQVWREWCMMKTAPLQEIGKVRMAEGRMLAFPNTVERKVEGNAKMVTLHLVDPSYRICSTRNVPPQQCEWWKDAVAEILLQKMPAELVELVLQWYDWPMSDATAEVVRAEMVEEHERFMVERHAAMD